MNGSYIKMEANKEDFTLLNLSKTSSSSDQSEELFKPESRIPKRKRRTKRRSTSSQNHNSSSAATQSASISQGTSQINVMYTVLIFLFCWIGTLTWLVFSLRNQLSDVTTRLDAASKLVKPFPDEVDTLNQTLQKLNVTLLDVHARLNDTQLRLNAVEKNVNSKPLPASDLVQVQKEVADLGSSLGSRVADLERDVNSMKAQATKNPTKGNNDGAPPSQQSAPLPNAR